MRYGLNIPQVSYKHFLTKWNQNIDIEYLSEKDVKITIFSHISICIWSKYVW